MSKYIKNIAIVGAGGNSGKYMAAALLATGKHTVTAITRLDSTSELLSGIISKKVDYSDVSSLVEALRGQDALVITLTPMAPRDTQSKLIQAAGEAGVQWLLPNEWGADTTNEALCKDVIGFQTHSVAREEIAKLGKSSFISVITNFWYEWSLAIPMGYGFDITNRSVTFFDDGETKINTSTWPQVGRSVAALLSLPIQPEGGDKERCLDHFRNKVVYVSSFTLNQKDMLESVLRVTKTSIDDWTVTKEPAVERYSEGLKAMKEGDRAGYARMMYTRMFYPDDCGNFGKTKGTSNEILGLPTEDLDEATAAAVERSKLPGWGMY